MISPGVLFSWRCNALSMSPNYIESKYSDLDPIEKRLIFMGDTLMAVSNSSLTSQQYAMLHIAFACSGKSPNERRLSSTDTLDSLEETPYGHAGNI